MKMIFKGICIAIVGVTFAFGIGWVVMHLWNWLIPGLTGWHTIDYWHAIGLLVLCKILFGGFGKGGRGCGHGGCGHRGWKHGKHGYWKKRWESKMENMSPEEKEKFMKGMNKCGWGHGDCEEDSSNEKVAQ